MPRTPATISHTAMALIVLTELGEQGKEVDDGYTWLAEHLDTTVLLDQRSVVESHNVPLVTAAQGPPRLFQSTLWHQALALAIVALCRNPKGPSWDLLIDATRTGLDEQGASGTVGAWSNAGAAEGISIWAVSPFIWAFSELLAQPTIAAPGTGVESHPGAIVVGPPGAGASLLTSIPDSATPLARLVAKDMAARLRRYLRSPGTTVILVLIVLAATVTTALGAISLVAGLTRGWPADPPVDPARGS